MEANLEDVLKSGYNEMDSAIEHLSDELSNVRAGKAHPSMVGSLSIDYYGSPTPLNQVASVTASDGRTLSIQPWEKSMLAVIEKAIFEANMGMTPMNNGEVIILSVPPLTEERRINLVKMCKSLGEEAKISIRNTRHKLMDAIKKEVKDGLPEDAGKRKEGEVQKQVDGHTSKVDLMITAKEKDIMTV